MSHFLFATAIILLALVALTRALEPPPLQAWSGRDVDACHNARAMRVSNERWGDSRRYRMADQVAPGIWVGSVCAAMDTSFIEREAIGLVISMADEWPFEGNLGQVNYIHRSLMDSVDENPTTVHTSFQLISNLVRNYRAETNGHMGVLIYCNMGISRSASTALFTLMDLTPSVSYDTLLKQMRDKRPIVRPNELYDRILRAHSNTKR